MGIVALALLNDRTDGDGGAHHPGSQSRDAMSLHKRPQILAPLAPVRDRKLGRCPCVVWRW